MMAAQTRASRILHADDQLPLPHIVEEEPAETAEKTEVSDYRTIYGFSSCQGSTGVLGKYMRIARAEWFSDDAGHPLPLARPEIKFTISSDDYLLLLDVLDELFILEAAARFCDRKASKTARQRLYRALALETGLKVANIQRIFKVVDRFDLSTVRAIARVILIDGVQRAQGQLLLEEFNSAQIIPFGDAK